jgi:hypothetical protein
LPQFVLSETTKNFEVDIEGKKVFYKAAGESEVYKLDWVDSGNTETDLARWLDKQVKQPDVPQAVLNFLISLSRTIILHGPLIIRAVLNSPNITLLLLKI